jgi:hypothetical protein
MQEVESDLDVFQKLRTFDNVSIAGGDPLLHPNIVDIVRRICERGLKPVLNTNGLALTRELLVDLKKAGIVGFTFHVDSKQGRPNWKDKDEVQMCELRSQFAEMVASVGGIACSFNSTVYPDTLAQVPDLVDWAQRNIDKVHTMVYIIYRHGELSTNRFDYFANGVKQDLSEIVYAETPETAARRVDIMAQDVVTAIRARHPDFEPCAYLNGTDKPDSFKWLAALRVGTKDKIHGYFGPKFMEAVQFSQHFFGGRYTAYVHPASNELGTLATLGGSIIDAGARAAGLSMLGRVLSDPLSLTRKNHVQALTIIQPYDVFDDGTQSQCDACPDVTVHEGRLVWSCRLEELRKYGAFLQTVPKARECGAGCEKVHT